MKGLPKCVGRTHSNALAGVVLMLTGIALFSINDALGKWLLTSYSVGELLLVRSTAALILLAPFVWQSGIAAFTTSPRPRLQIVRAVLATLEVVMFFWAVSYLPLADAVTFYLAGPIYVLVLSVLLLDEKVGWRRWTAVLLGFAGVVLALRPSMASVTLPALIALCGSFSYALVMITTRLLRATSNRVLIVGQMVGTFVFGAAVAPFGWVIPSARDFALLSLFGVLSIIALACVNGALRLAAASVVVPYQYTLIVWAILLGYAVFGDSPDAFMLAGASVIVITGLYIFKHEDL
jgi:drug/metabolite transporter (DMT)-like permease